MNISLFSTAGLSLSGLDSITPLLQLSSTWIKEIRLNKAEKSEGKKEQQQLPDSFVTEWQEFFARSVKKACSIPSKR